MYNDLRGLWVPLITPFDAHDRVDAAALERLCRDVLLGGATGVVVLGTTGEPATLDAGERRLVIRTCADVCTGLARTMIVGAGGNSTRHALLEVGELAGTPALAGVLSVVPYYTRPTAQGVVEHVSAIAAASPAPLVLYNVPARTGLALDAPTVLEIAAIANVAGMKQAVGAVDVDTLEVLRSRPDGFHLLAGDDAIIGALMAMGASGAIAASAHLCTGSFAELVGHGLAGRGHELRAAHERLLPVVRAGFAEPNPAVFKAALHALGRIATPDVRLPLMRATPGATRRLVDAVSAAEGAAAAAASLP